MARFSRPTFFKWSAFANHYVEFYLVPAFAGLTGLAKVLARLSTTAGRALRLRPSAISCQKIRIGLAMKIDE
jgi:hypothetical protein